MRLVLGFAALLSLAAPALAADAVSYAGTLGDTPIILELAISADGGAQAGRYAVLSKGVDIPLRAAGEAGAIRLQEEKPCTVPLCGSPDEAEELRPAFGAEWVLEADGEHVVLAGQRRDLATGETLDVSLTRKGTRAIPDDAFSPLAALDPLAAAFATAEPFVMRADAFPYDFLKMDVTLKEGVVEKAGEGAVRMDEDPRVGLAYPHVVALGDADPALLNQALAGLRVQNAMSSFSCLSAVYLGFGWFNGQSQGTTGYEDGGMKVAVDHLTPRLMGLTESGSFWCGGAHPSHVATHRLLDARTGEAVEPESLLSGWRTTGRDGTAVDPAAYDNSDYSLVAGPDEALVAFVRENRRKFDAPTESGCAYDEILADYLGVYVKANSLVFTLKDLPHAMFACKDDLLAVPLEEARPLLTSTGARYFAVLD